MIIMLIDIEPYYQYDTISNAGVETLYFDKHLVLICDHGILVGIEFFSNRIYVGQFIFITVDSRLVSYAKNHNTYIHI